MRANDEREDFTMCTIYNNIKDVLLRIGVGIRHPLLRCCGLESETQARIRKWLHTRCIYCGPNCVNGFPHGLCRVCKLRLVDGWMWICGHRPLEKLNTVSDDTCYALYLYSTYNFADGGGRTYGSNGFGTHLPCVCVT